MLNLLFPKICNGCKSILLGGEKIICTHCRHHLTLTNYHKYNDDAMKNIFYGKFPLLQATALIKFEKRSISQEILHNLKYRGQEKISSFFGNRLGAELAEIESYKDIDLVIPVPLHAIKLKKRGYNQVEGFGRAIANALGCDYRNDILIKISKSGPQAFRKRMMRFEHEEIFTVQNPEALESKHILLVDDIVTTGATLEKCALTLLSSKDIILSIATIAIA